MAAVSTILMVLLLCVSSAVFAETETETQTQTTSIYTGSQQYLQILMVPSPVSGAPGYPQGNGSAEIYSQSAYFSVHFQASGMARGARFGLVLTANGTSYPLANMTASNEGEVEAEATISLPPGSYHAGLNVFDYSTFGSPTVVLVSSPGTQLLSVASAQSTTTTMEVTQSVSTFQGGESEDDDIRTAIQTGVIPAVINLGESGPSIVVDNGNFSVSVGRYQTSGYLVSISATNVSGPRVLLFNLTSAQGRALFTNPVMITLDGAQVQQAGSLSQVLGAQQGDPARFVLVSTATGMKLLISIPHFSYHTIGIVPVLAQLGATLLIDLPAVVIAAVAVTLVVVITYSRRTRVVL